MLPPHIQERVQLFVYLLQSLRMEGCETDKIRESFRDYGMNNEDFENLWTFYLELEAQWNRGVRMFLDKGTLDDESKFLLEGISDPFFTYLCEQQKRERSSGLWNRLSGLWRKIAPDKF